MIAILFLAVASIFTSSVESHLNYINELFYGSPYVRWLYVFIGMQIAAVVTKRYFTTGLMNGMEIICAVCVGFWFVYRNIVGAPLVILRLADIILCAVCLFVFSIGGGPISRMLSNDKFLFAGKISSYIFIVHFVVICYVDLLFEKNRYVVGQWTGVLELLIIIGLIYIIIRSICRLEKING